MFISQELQENCDEIGRIISFGNKAGWPVDEPIDKWVERYNTRLNSPQQATFNIGLECTESVHEQDFVED